MSNYSATLWPNMLYPQPTPQRVIGGGYISPVVAYKSATETQIEIYKALNIVDRRLLPPSTTNSISIGGVPAFTILAPPK